MNRFLLSFFTTWRDRGFSIAVGATLHHMRAMISKYIFKRRYIEKKVHSYKMLLDLEDLGLSRSLLLFGKREIDHQILLAKIVEPCMTIYDIGSNIGYYPLMELELLGPKGRLIAIEPSPKNVELLRRNLSLNGYGEEIPIISGAVSDTPASRAFHLSPHSNLGTFHPEGSAQGVISGHTIEVRTYTVPQLAALHGSPDLIRMDVEGHEVEVLNGLLEAVEDDLMRPQIIFETHLTRYTPEHDMEKTLNALFDLGYEVPFAATSWQGGTKIVKNAGYDGGQIVKTDGVERMIVSNIERHDAIDLICRKGGLRAVVLRPQISTDK